MSISSFKNKFLGIFLFLALLCFAYQFLTQKQSKSLKDPKDLKIIDLKELIKEQKPVFKTRVLKLKGKEYKQILSGEIGKRGGLLVKSLLGASPKTFNYWISNDSTSSSLASLMYVGLVNRDPWTGEIIPDLAKKFEIKKAGRQILVYLREKLEWSDGELITADDVLFTWNKIVKERFERLGTIDTVSFKGEFPKIKKINDYLVSFETKEPFAPLLSSLSYPIAPAHYFKKKFAAAGVDSSVSAQKKAFATFLGTGSDPREFIVSGAFKLQRYIPGQRIEFVRNQRYFTFDRALQRLPYFEKLIVLILPSSDLELFKFVSGELSFLDLELDTLKVLKKISPANKFQVYRQGVSPSSIFFVFNLAKSKDWFKERAFREALELAIDRQQIIDTVYQGMGIPLCLFFSPKSIYYDHVFAQKSCHLRANLKKARALLKKAGFSLDSQKILRDQKNQAVKFSLYTNAGGSLSSNSPREAMAILLKEQWAQLGIELNFKTIEFNNLVQRLSPGGEWESMIIGLSGGDLFEPNSSKNVLKSDARLHLFKQRAENSNQEILPWEAKIDRLLDQGVSSFEASKRKIYYSQIQKIIYEQRPLLFLASPERLTAVSENKFGNLQPSQLAGLTWNLEQLYFLH